MDEERQKLIKGRTIGTWVIDISWRFILRTLNFRQRLNSWNPYGQIQGQTWQNVKKSGHVESFLNPVFHSWDFLSILKSSRLENNFLFTFFLLLFSACFLNHFFFLHPRVGLWPPTKTPVWPSCQHFTQTHWHTHARVHKHSDTHI